MQVKTYRAAAIRDALEQVKADLGPNAVILSTQRVDDQSDGHGGSIVEIQAALEPIKPSAATGLQYFQKVSPGRAYWKNEDRQSSRTPSEGPRVEAALQDMLGPLMDEVRSLRAIVEQAKPMELEPELGPEPILELKPEYELEPKLPSESAFDVTIDLNPDPMAFADAQPHMIQLPDPDASSYRGQKSTTPTSDIAFEQAFYSKPERDEPRDCVKAPTTVSLLTRELPRRDTRDALALQELRRTLMGETAAAAAPPDQAEPLVREQIERWEQQPFRLLERWLHDADVEQSCIQDLVQGVQDRLGHTKRPTRDQLEGALFQTLHNQVQLSPIETRNTRRAIAFIGPTGVGKTTTLAKQAADLVLNQRKSVGILTIDTYRIGAVEQLRKYATMLRSPLEVVIDRPSLRAALRRLEHFDVLLIDTIGGSPRNSEPLDRLGDLLHIIPDLSYELCISSTTALRDMRGIIDNYQQLDPESLLFTKLDETFAAGPMLSAHLGVMLPLSSFTTGQSVPDDIEDASIERILSMLLPS